MKQKILLLLILLFLLVSACSNNEDGSLDSQEIRSEVGEDDDENDDEDEDENDDDDSDDEDEDENDDEECERDDDFDRCIYSDGSGWLNLEQNRKNYSLPEYESFSAPNISSQIWNQVNGPYASVILDIAKTNDGFWVGSDGDSLSFTQIHYANNNSLVWSLKKDIRAPLTDLAADPNNSNNVAFTTGQGWGEEASVFLSIDNGSVWKRITPEEMGEFLNVEFSIDNPVKIFVIGRDAFNGIVNTYLYTTSNFGDDWSRALLSSEEENPYAETGGGTIVPHPTKSNVIFCVCNGLLKSEDGGTSWKSLVDGSDEKYNIISIAISESSPEIIFARMGERDKEECDSADDLRDEERTEEAIEVELEYCSVVIKSEDGGLSWIFPVPSEDQPAINGDFAEGNIFINPFNENDVYNVWARVVIRSENSGDNWKYLFRTTEFPHVPDVGIHKILAGESSSELFIGGIGGFFKSEDSGKTWVPKSTGISGTDVLDVEFAVDGTAYAATQNHGVWKSYDGGVNWTYASYGIKSFYGMQLLTHPTNPEVLYYTTSGGVYKTDNGGMLWKISDTLCKEETDTGCHYHGLIIDPDNPEQIYLGGGGDDGTPDGIGIKKTPDDGLTWNDSDEGFVKDIHVSKMAVDPSNPDIFYASTQGAVHLEGKTVEKTSDGAGVFKSTNKGETWKQINNGLGTLETNVIVVDPNDSSTLYVGTDDDGLYKSTNSGETWVKMNIPNVPDNFGVGDIVVDPENSNVVYVGTLDYFRLAVDESRGVIGEYGIFRTIDGGKSWSEFNEGLKHPGIFSLAIDKENRVLLAGTRRGGIYWLSLDD